MATATTTPNWDDCLGGNDSWLLRPLREYLQYQSPLPVQQAVVPTVQRALLSGLPMDVCLTAPTGSGKTLCYLLPMLRLVAECKRGVDHTRLRALVLVPTKALGAQVFRELQQLTRGTSIAVVSLCKDNTVKEEAEALVRAAAVLPPVTSTSRHLPHEAGNVEDKNDNISNGGGINMARNSNEKTREDSLAVPSPLQLCYYSRADIVIATPQRLLRHLDATAGLSLADLRLLVIDEADQVLAGNFANFVAKVVERFEEEQLARLTDKSNTRRLMHLTYSLHKMLCSATLSSHVARVSEVRLRNCRHFALDTFGSDISREDEGEPLQLRFPDNKSKKLKGKKRGGATANSDDDDDESELDENNDPAEALPISRQQLVHTSFALPPRLQEHVVFVEDWYRHAVLLKLIRSIIAKQSGEKLTETPLKRKGKKEDEKEQQDQGRVKDSADPLLENDSETNSDDDYEEEEDKDHADAEFRALGHRRRRRRQHNNGTSATYLHSNTTTTTNNNNNNATTASPSNPDGISRGEYPFCDDDAGERILIFCRSAEEARVMGHFLLSAGVRATEFTTLTTESERRRALLKSAPDTCVVASDALMRGVDVPNVGHVIMYHPPETLSQYVHRAGRTARAMRAGHLHMLLQKNGPSGTQRDGEVAVFKALSATIARTLPVRYERHFFMFDRPPTSTPIMAAATGKCSNNNNDTSETEVRDKTQLLVDEANELLKTTQARLAGHWTSAHESKKKNTTSDKAVRAPRTGKSGDEPPTKKEKR